MIEFELTIPPGVTALLRGAIERAGGNEVFFFGRVSWGEQRGERQSSAELRDVEVFARGNAVSVPAVLQGAEDWDLALHNHPSGQLTPSDADVAMAAEFAQRGVGFVILSNDASRHYVVVRPLVREQAQRLDLDEVRSFFEPGGPLSAHVGGFEGRPGQIEMAVEVARAINEDRVVACEAGTGVGKSFAYLVPSILWALRNRERVLVSTGTIQLQEQLVGKDLPVLEKVFKSRLNAGVRYALIKGRNNYACRRKLGDLKQEARIIEGGEDPREREMLDQLIAWAAVSRDGSRADLSWVPPPAVWERVMSETEKSLRVKCKHYHECFFYQAKREASRAQIVVANHHLLFADLALRRQRGEYEFDLILPRYRRLIVDEAHHLEDVAGEHFGLRWTHAGLRQRLGRMLSRDGTRGALPFVTKRLRQLGDNVAAEAVEGRFLRPLPEVLSAVEERLEELEGAVEAEASRPEAGGGAAADDEAASSRKLRLGPSPGSRRLRDEIGRRLDLLRRDLERIARLNDSAREAVKRSSVPEGERDSLALELEAFGKRLEGFIASVQKFCDFDDESLARWVELRDDSRAREGGRLGFAAAPVRVGEDLKTALFEPMASIVLTSATLSVAGDVRFLGDRLGFAEVGGSRFAFRTHPSPFDFQRQVLLVIPADLPAPNRPGYEERLSGAVYRLLEASRGRAFVLFTSYALLRRLHAALSGPLVRLGLRPLAQGEAQRSDLLQRFREAPGGVLFGTDSFWEGVDVKGRALEQVILTRLPFRVPSEPLQEARIEDLERRGKDPFRDFTVPQAVLKFKQGFGRLIRAATDRGVVAVLDSRILGKSYGRLFLASLPRTRVCADTEDLVVRQVEAFFGEALANPAEETAAAPAVREAAPTTEEPLPWK